MQCEDSPNKIVTRSPWTFSFSSVVLSSKKRLTSYKDNCVCVIKIISQVINNKNLSTFSGINPLLIAYKHLCYHFGGTNTSCSMPNLVLNVYTLSPVGNSLSGVFFFFSSLILNNLFKFIRT